MVLVIPHFIDKAVKEVDQSIVVLFIMRHGKYGLDIRPDFRNFFKLEIHDSLTRSSIIFFMCEDMTNIYLMSSMVYGCNQTSFIVCNIKQGPDSLLYQRSGRCAETL